MINKKSESPVIINSNPNPAKTEAPRHASTPASSSLSLTDEFAKSALQGVLTGIDLEDGLPIILGEIAKFSYDMAEAMLAERQKRLNRSSSR